MNKEIELLLIDSNGEITPEIELLMNLEDQNEKLNIEERNKYLLWLSKKHEEVKLRALARKNKIELLQKQLNSANNSILFWENKIKNLLINNYITEIELENFDIKLSESKFVDIINEDLIDDKYFTIKESKNLSKANIKKDLEKGIEVSGAKISSRINISIK